MKPIFVKMHEALKLQKPFVVYKKPNADTVFGMFQNNANTYTVSTFLEQGFVFAPFNSEKESLLIPSEKATILLQKIDFSVKNTLTNLANFSSEGKQQHLDLVNLAISEIKKGVFEKVVVSRKELVHLKTKDITTILQQLLLKYKKAFVYCWFHPKTGLWLGASPEILLKTTAQTFTTMALAGTQKYQENASEKWTAKERHEQQVVVDYITSKLDFITDLKTTKTTTVQAANVCHLQTIISGNFKSSELKKIVTKLHPTPAVCGFPKEKAKQFILNNEAYKRSYYTGFFGTLNIESNTFLAVNLRCMQIENSTATLYVGGGITKDSAAEKEWQETVEKATVMRSVLS